MHVLEMFEVTGGTVGAGSSENIAPSERSLYSTFNFIEVINRDRVGVKVQLDGRSDGNRQFYVPAGSNLVMEGIEFSRLQATNEDSNISTSSGDIIYRIGRKGWF